MVFNIGGRRIELGQSDNDILKRLSLNQAEFARLIGTSRQAVNAGIRKGESYIDQNRLFIVYDEFCRRADRRIVIVAEILKTNYEVSVERTSIDILNLQLPESCIKLINENRSLRTYLNKKVYEIIKIECEKLEYLVE